MLDFFKKRNGLCAFMIIFFWMIGLVASNFATSQNLERNQLNKSIRQLADEQRILDAQVSQLQALDRIELVSQRLNLIKVDSKNVAYLTVADDKVALK
jgi:hypothetical protein